MSRSNPWWEPLSRASDQKSFERYSSPDGKLKIYDVYRIDKIFGVWWLTTGQRPWWNRRFRTEAEFFAWAEDDFAMRKDLGDKEHFRPGETEYELQNGLHVRITEHDYD